MMKQFEENYAVRDKQDVISMCALLLKVEQKQIDNTINGMKLLRKLKNWCTRSISRQLNVLYRN
jgi:cell division protein ZapA